jgi:hypothetical protein
VAGWRPVTILIAETVFIAGLVIAAVRLLM